MNLIEITTTRLGFLNPKKDLAEAVISSFDINCCKVGVYSSHLAISKSFIEFFKTKALKVDHPFTPSSTTTRLFKKGYDLQLSKESYLKEIEFLKQINFFYSDEPFVRTKLNFENYDKKYLPYKKDIDEHYFVMIDDENMVTFFPKGEIDSKMVEYIRKGRKPFITSFRDMWDPQPENKSLFDKALDLLPF